jgi:radical SAM protein with 4Fe4S-binding SPASM domain
MVTKLNFGDPEFRNKLYSSPIYLQLDLTNKCNMNCEYCYNKHFVCGQELTDDQFLELSDQILKDIKPLFVTFSGGEPFVRKNILFKLAKIFKEKEIEVYVNTNGTLINEEIAKKIGELKIDKVSINIESLDKEEHEKLRGLSGCWDRSLNSIELLKKYAPNCNVVIRTVVNKKNYLEVEKIANFVKSLGLKEYMLIDFIPKADDQHLMLNKEEWAEFYKKYLNIKKLGLRIVPNHAILFLERTRNIDVPFCMAGRIKLIINANGDVVPCNHLKEKQFVAGNVLKENLKDIWENSKILKEFRELVPEKCSGCGFKNQCSGGCHAMAYYVAGDYKARDPYCEMGLKNE